MSDEPAQPIDLAAARKKKRKEAARAAVENAAPAEPAAAQPATDSGDGARLQMTGIGLVRRRLEGGPLLISGPFEVLTETNDVENQSWGLLLRFRDRDRALQSLVATRDMFTGEKGDLASLLARRGLYVHPGRGSAAALNEYLAGVVSPKRARVVGRTGWHRIEGAEIFVLPNKTFGETAAEIIFEAEGGEPPPFNVAGTLEGWRSEVAAACAGNPRLILALCCAFAAPLLGPLGEQGGGFHFFGKSSTGKTTAARVAASVWGGEAGSGALGFVRQWRATGNGLEGLARAHSDVLLIMDEIGAADPASLAETAYMLANGRGRERLDRSGRPRRVVQFRSLFLSTGEQSFAEKMVEAQKKARAGQVIRMVDISADAGADMGIFETVHDAESPEAFAGMLREATMRVYGVAGLEFLRYLVERLGKEADFADKARAWLDNLVRRWLVPFPGADGQVVRTAGRFALLAVAGELAGQAGITGWAPSMATGAIAAVFRAWLAERGTVGAREDAQAVEQLRDFIGRHGATRFEEWRDPEPQTDALQADPDAKPPNERFRTVNRAGWRRWVLEDDGKHGWRYYLTSEGMGEALAGLNRRQAHVTLIARGFLIADGAGRSSKALSVPGHRKVRLYEVPSAILGAESGGD